MSVTALSLVFESEELKNNSTNINYSLNKQDNLKFVLLKINRFYSFNNITKIDKLSYFNSCLNR